MSAREEILKSIRARKAAALPRPVSYAREIEGDLVARFSACASAANATVHILDTLEEVPGCVADLLRARNLAAVVHFPTDAMLEGENWDRVTVSREAPGPDDTALSVAPYGVAETGTLVYPASPERPASWHFRPGFEIAVLQADDIVPSLEAALSKLRERDWPHTINLVTGPSRTADIEQTLELGAHGPKALAILLIRARPAG
ncbi:MAG TPA: LUD domain-containing protein [Rhizomicrobium sp.]